MLLKLSIALALVVFLSLMLNPQAKGDTQFSWSDNFSYTSIAQLENGGWSISSNPSGVSFSNGTVILDGTSGDTLIVYTGHFPAGISDWRVEDVSMWPGVGHSQPVVEVQTDKHGYSFAADGWYSVFAFYRDSTKTTFGTYQEQVGTWVNMTMLKQGNTIYMYYNGQLEQTYVETDNASSQAVGVSLIAPWEGNEAFEYIQFDALSATNASGGGVSNEVWVPAPQNAAAATVVAAVATGAASLVFTAFTNPLGGLGGKIGERLGAIFPENFKSWLEAIVASRRKLKVEAKTGSPLMPTATEILAYVLLIILLTLSFSYVKASSLDELATILPVYFATAILVGLVKKFFSIAFLRSRGIWTEHVIWPFGLGLFVVTTLAFRVPFSSPTRNVTCPPAGNESSHLVDGGSSASSGVAPKSHEHLHAIVSASEILITLAFAGLFALLFLAGFVAIGSAGLAMCLMAAFFDTFPIPPMSGKGIYDHDKKLWFTLFASTLVLYSMWLIFL